MPSSIYSASHPRVRLSLLTHSTLGHDVSAAFKASQPGSSRSSAIQETPAPPPSPVDFGFPTRASHQGSAAEWSLRTNSTTKQGLVGA